MRVRADIWLYAVRCWTSETVFFEPVPPSPAKYLLSLALWILTRTDATSAVLEGVVPGGLGENCPLVKSLWKRSPGSMISVRWSFRPGPSLAG